MNGAVGLGSLLDLSRVPRPAAAGVAAVAVTAVVVVMAPYYYRLGVEGTQPGVAGVDLTESATDGDGPADRNAMSPDRTGLGRGAEVATSPGVVRRTRRVSDVVAKAAAILEARDGAGDGTEEELRRLRREVKLRLLRSKLASGLGKRLDIPLTVRRRSSSPCRSDNAGAAFGLG